MTVKSANSPGIVATGGDLGDNLARFRRSLRAEDVSPNTILAYCGAVERLADFLVGEDMPTDVSTIRREHLKAFIADALDRFKPATANHRFRGVQRFFNYLVDEGALAAPPMARMRPPRIAEDPPAVLSRPNKRTSWPYATVPTSRPGATRRSSACSWIPVRGGRRWLACAGRRTTG